MWGNAYIHCMYYIYYMQERITLSVYKTDKERLAPYFKAGDSWADALKRALDKLERQKK